MQMRSTRKVISMGVLKDIVLLITVASGIVGVCCIASGVRMYSKKKIYATEGVYDDIKGLAYINISLGVLLLIVSVVIGIGVYGVRF